MAGEERSRWEGEGGVADQFESQDRPLSETDKKGQVVCLATRWIEQNRPDLAPYVKHAYFEVAEHLKRNRYFVRGAVKGRRGYEYFSFWVVIEPEKVEFIREHR